MSTKHEFTGNSQAFEPARQAQFLRDGGQGGWTLGKKLIASFLGVGLIPFLILGLLTLSKSKSALEGQAFSQLESVRAIKKAQIDRFFAERKGDMGVLVETVKTLQDEAFAKLTAIREIKKNQIQDYFAER